MGLAFAGCVRLERTWCYVLGYVYHVVCKCCTTTYLKRMPDTVHERQKGGIACMKRFEGYGYVTQDFFCKTCILIVLTVSLTLARVSGSCLDVLSVKTGLTSIRNMFESAHLPVLASCLQRSWQYAPREHLEGRGFRSGTGIETHLLQP